MRQPNQIIGGDYLSRWHLIPHNRFVNVYLHRFGRSDDDRALHDHPWPSVSFLLKGRLSEVYQRHLTMWPKPVECRRSIRRFLPVFRSSKFAHRLVLEEGPAWTIFITGPKVREWGFHCPKGWRHWTKFTSKDGNSVGAGCE